MYINRILHCIRTEKLKILNLFSELKYLITINVVRYIVKKYIIEQKTVVWKRFLTYSPRITGNGMLRNFIFDGFSQWKRRSMI